MISISFSICCFVFLIIIACTYFSKEKINNMDNKVFSILILINLLGVLGLIPLTGVPLPFLSYGGSYNMCVIISMFMIQRIHYENKEAKLRKKIENL